MTTAVLYGQDGADSPISYALAQAIDAAFRNVSLSTVNFTEAPQEWFDSAPEHQQGITTARKQNLRYLIAERDGNACAYCGQRFVDIDLATLDHVIPNAIVRHWEPWNLVLACLPCNNLKASRIPTVFMPLIAHLLVALLPLAQQKVAWRVERKARKAARRALECGTAAQAHAATLIPSTATQDGDVA